MYSGSVALSGKLGAGCGGADQQHLPVVPIRSSGPRALSRTIRAISITFLPDRSDAEAGFGGVLNAFELMKAMIEAGAAAVHFEDQLASVKKCGHMGGKVLVPTQEAHSETGRGASGS